MISKIEPQNKLLVILGPTATGKTDLALKLAKQFKGELVACDSRQVYTGLDIGTGKLPNQVRISNFQFPISNIVKHAKFWEIDGIKIWMYDVVSPKKQYTIVEYIDDAERVIKDILQRGMLPIIVGGTGLYIKGLLEGIPNLEIPIDKGLRKDLQKLSLDELQKRLKKLSPTKWKNLNQSDRQNPRRLLRSIEIIMNPYAELSNKRQVTRNKFNTLKIGLTAPRETLYKKVDLRVLSRISQGMVQEAKELRDKGLSFRRMRQLGLEYGVLADYLENKTTNDEMMKAMEGKIHGYVRRQQTWFKREKNILWFDVTVKNWAKKVEKKVQGWYNG